MKPTDERDDQPAWLPMQGSTEALADRLGRLVATSDEEEAARYEEWIQRYERRLASPEGTGEEKLGRAKIRLLKRSFREVVTVLRRAASDPANATDRPV